MKDLFVAQLEPEQTITGFFLVCAKEMRASQKSGKPYLQMELGDKTGTIDARLFQDVENNAPLITPEDVVKIRGRVDTYNGRKQVVVELIRPAKPEEFDIADFIPATKLDVDALYAQLSQFVAGVGNPWLRQLLEGVITDPEIAPKLKRAPAGKSMHHAYLGGLLEHIVSLCGLCRLAAPHYPELDGDLILAGAVLHDIGKLEELTYHRAIGYTNEGILLGHIVTGAELVARRMDAIEGFPASLKTMLRHVILSHHGELEFGSPVLPRVPEALFFHYLDQIDSKMAAMRESLASPGGEGDWTSRNMALQRTLLRTERFRKDEAAAAPAEAPPESIANAASPAKGG